jgi:seryl-tRNA synthetase
MLDTKLVRTNPEAVAEQLVKKKFEFPTERYNELESQRREVQVQTEKPSKRA